MDNLQFKTLRSRLAKTQKELSQLLGISVKAVHSYEQGWRKVPHHVERQLLFLLSRVLAPEKEAPKCWDINQCPEEKLSKCPAWEFSAGNMCWFINGTKCSGQAHNSWEDKMEECRTCKVFLSIFNDQKGSADNG
jgi:DNA-binding XRE family transcriptional regulator